MSVSYREVEFLDPVYIEINELRSDNQYDDEYICHYDSRGDLIGIEIHGKITVKGFLSNVRDAGEPTTADI